MNPTLPSGAPNAKSRRAQGPEKIVQIARRRAIVPMLEATKSKLYRTWLRGTPEKDLASMFQLRREEVELILHEYAIAGGTAAA